MDARPMLKPLEFGVGEVRVVSSGSMSWCEHGSCGLFCSHAVIQREGTVERLAKLIDYVTSM
jgi:hypothetical protein